MSNTTNENIPQELRIVSINVNKSIHAQTDLIGRLDPNDYDIVAIQEPGFDFKGDSRATRKWTTIYPLDNINNDERPRSMILVNANLSSSSWVALPIASPDVTGIQIEGQSGTLRIFNIYNAQEHDNNMKALETFLKGAEARPEHELTLNDIWLGDFNRHSPMWDELRNSQLFTAPAIRSAQKLIDMTGRWSMRMALAPGINTLEHASSKNWTRPDNIWVDEELLRDVIKCDVLASERPICTDHLPIILTLNRSPARSVAPNKLDWRGTDWPEFVDSMRDEAGKLATGPVKSIADFDHRLNLLTEAVNRVIGKHVKTVKPSPYTKRWWSRELAQMRKQVSKLSRKCYTRKHQGNTTDPIHIEHRALRNQYTQLIRDTKTEHWLTWLDGVDAKSIWNVHKFIANPTGDSSATRVPPLKVKLENGTTRTISDNEGKAEAFHKVFFPPAPAINSVPANPKYPKPVTTFQNITNLQVDRAIKRLKPYKAGGDDNWSNSIFTHCRTDLVPILADLYRATFAHKYCPESWKSTTTVVLRKGGKPDYSLPKAYRPIVLLRNITNICSSIVAEDITHISETHNMLEPNQFGGRPKRSCVDSLTQITHWIFQKWRKGLVVSGLFLDIQGAFPNTVIPVLIHDMRMRGIPKEYTDWVKRRLDGRTTVLTFDDFRSSKLQIGNGLDQGDCFSPTGFNFYGGDLVTASNNGNEFKTAFVDDTLFLAAAPKQAEAIAMLKDMMERPNGANDWAAAHNSRFEIDKFGLVHFSRDKIADPARPGKKILAPRMPVNISGHVIQPTTTYKLLGVIIDQELKFKEHANYALGKGQKYMAQARRLVKGKRGVPGRQASQLFTGVVAAKMLYAAEVWCNPICEPSPGKKKRTGSIAFANKLAAVQRSATIFITGGLRSTATTVLDAHCNILPIHLAINKICMHAAARWATLPHHHPLHAIARTAALRRPNKMPAPIHHIFSTFNIDPKSMETIKAVRQSTKWTSPIKIFIAPDKTTALKNEMDDYAGVKAYSDGSGFEGGIGAAAVVYRYSNGKSTKSVLRYYLGPESKHTVYEAELVGELLVMHLLQKPPKGLGRTSIYVDNQASLLATQAIKPAPGHRLIDLLQAKHLKVKKSQRNINITMNWIPAHKDVAGNEEADKQAKRAAQAKGQDDSANNKLPPELRLRPIPSSKSAAVLSQRRHLDKQATAVIRKSKQWATIGTIDPSLPSKQFKRNIDCLTRRQATLYMQLRTGHAPLNKHLHNMKCTDSPVCPACENNFETVHHYLLDCPATSNLRRSLFFPMGRAARSLKCLLSSPKALRPLFKFIGRTKRFKNAFGDDLEMASEDPK